MPQSGVSCISSKSSTRYRYATVGRGFRTVQGSFIFGIPGGHHLRCHKTLPAYVNNFELQDHIQRLSTQLAVRTKPITPDSIRNEVVAFAQDHGVPLTADNVKVTIASRVSISVDYTVAVDLMVYTLELHFTPSAENLSL